MKKTVAIILLTLVLAFSAVSCAEDIDTTELLTYVNEGLEFSLPRYMRASDPTGTGYDMYFDNLKVFYTVKELDKDTLTELDLPETTTADEYFDHLMQINSLDKDKVFYERDEESKKINFRYIYDNGTETETAMMYFVVIVGDPGNLWYIEMCCSEEDSEGMLSTFRSWMNHIEVTDKSETDKS